MAVYPELRPIEQIIRDTDLTPGFIYMLAKWFLEEDLEEGPFVVKQRNGNFKLTCVYCPVEPLSPCQTVPKPNQVYSLDTIHK